jgi:hypothetical protein
MARGSWFVGSTKKPVGGTANTALLITSLAGRGDVGRLANQLRVGVNIGGIDPNTERDPPARATTLVFPEVAKTPTVRWSSEHPPPDYQRLFASIQRAEVWLSNHLLALNCDRHSPCHGDTLLPLRDDNTLYIPARTSTDKDFATRIAELDITHDAASRALARTPKPGDTVASFLHMRKFWLALDNMAQYWDTSADDYYLIKADRDSSKPGYDMFTKDVERYKGRRISNGSQMPDKYRVDTVNAFVEGVTAAFNWRISPPYVAENRFAPIMQVGNLEQPVRLTSVVMRLPTGPDKPTRRDKAKALIREGPVMGVLERNTTDLDSTLPDYKVSARKSEHDLLREIAAMLMLAQQRARKQKGPITPPKDAWYLTKPRWGGGSGSKLPGLQQAEEERDEVMIEVGYNPAGSAELAERLHYATRNLQKAQLASRDWKTLKPRMSLWSDKIDYQAIGKPPGSPYDEVSSVSMHEWDLTDSVQIFLVSCLYHHVSILKLTIHDAYTEYLTTGSMPKQAPVEEDWCSPKLERTVWYDLLDQTGRVEAFSCIWGVMEYLNRDVAASKPDVVETSVEAQSKAL